MKKLPSISIRLALITAFTVIGLTIILTGIFENQLLKKENKLVEELSFRAHRLEEIAGQMKYIVVNTQRIAMESIITEEEQVLLLAPLQANRFYELSDKVFFLLREENDFLLKKYGNLKKDYLNFLTQVLSMSAQFVEGVETSKDKLFTVNQSAQLFINELNGFAELMNQISKNNIEQIRENQRNLLFLNQLSLGIIFIVVLAALFFLERKQSRPLSKLMLFVRELTGKEVTLSKRIDLKGDDEFSELAASLNLMLDRLEKTTVSRNRLMEEIAERKSVEVQLKFQSSLVQQSSEGIAATDMDGDLLYVNDAFARMHRYLPKDLAGKNLAVFHTPEQMPALALADKQLEKTGEFSGEIWRLKSDKTLFPVIVHNSLLLDDEGTPVGIIQAARDISDLKQAEEALLASHQELEQRVKERTAELAKINEDLKLEIDERQRIESELLTYQEQLRELSSELLLAEERERRRFAAELHDGIGQNLALSLNTIEMLRDSDASEALIKALDKVVGLLEETIKGTSNLTEKLSPPILYDLGLVAAVEALSEEFESLHGLKIEVADNNLERPANMDIEALLFRTARELLINVVKHAKVSKARISIYRKNGEISMAIEDDGVGFDMSSHRKKPVTNGRGFGLFSIRERIRHLGGMFEIETQPGQGTIVSLTIPYEV